MGSGHGARPSVLVGIPQSALLDAERSDEPGLNPALRIETVWVFLAEDGDAHV